MRSRSLFRAASIYYKYARELISGHRHLHKVATPAARLSMPVISDQGSSSKSFCSTNAKMHTHARLLQMQFRTMATLQRESQKSFPEQKTKYAEPQNTTQNTLMLIDAVRTNDLKLVDTFVKQYPQLATQQPHVLDDRIGDNTPAHEAARNGNLLALKLIVDNAGGNFNVNYQCHCTIKRTMLSYAVSGGHEDVVNYLFTLGANPNIHDERQWSAMDEAIHGIYQGKNVPVYERIALTIADHNGIGNQFKEAGEKVNEIRTRMLTEKYHNTEESEKETERFLEELRNPLQITQGKSR